MTAYDRLTARFARIGTISEASAVLGWDAAAMMPPGGGAARGDQLAVLAGLAHGLLIAPEVGADLDAAEAAGPVPTLIRGGRPICDLMRHAYTRATALPPALVEAQARANSACEKVWREARRTADFALVRPHLHEVVRLVREAAAALAPALGLSPYDALMDGFQRGIGAADVVPVFADYEAFLRRALPEADRAPGPDSAPRSDPEARSRSPCRRRCAGAYPSASASTSPMRASTAPPTRSRAARRPTCGSPPATTRRTSPRPCSPSSTRPGTRCTSGDCRRRYARQPVGEAAGMAAHESQSLIVEMQACRSDAFLSWLGPELHATFGGEAAPYRPGNLAGLWRRIEPGFIRVEADEMTYPAHVILRFRLEQALIAGDLAVDRPAGRLERGDARPAGHHPAGRRTRMPAGHPLVRRRLRLLPELHAWVRWRRRNSWPPPAGRCRLGRGLGPRRSRAAAGLAAAERPRQGQSARLQRPAAARPPASHSTRRTSRRI